MSFFAVTVTHAWFDMDHTLIDNDCDVSWKDFVIAERLADPLETKRLADEFYQQYIRGELDVDAFMSFQLREFAGRGLAEMAILVREHFERMVRPKIYKAAELVLSEARRRRLQIALLTSTNAVLAAPLAEYFGITEIHAPELELNSANIYTGKLRPGIYPNRRGKMDILLQYCADQGVTPDEFAYFGDSINDAEVLCRVAQPVAVNPAENLRPLLPGHCQIVNWH